MFVKREEASMPAEAPAEPPPPPVAATPAMTEPAPVAVEVPPEPVAPPPPPAPVQVPSAPVAPLPAVEPIAVITARPALNPGEAWTGEIKGRPARKFDIPAEASAASNTGDVPEQPDAAEPVMTAQASPAPAAPPPPVYDEDAAMRAIEGGWSRTRARAMPGAPELADVGAAVAAAQSAVEQVLAQAGIDPEAGKHAGKPAGLPRPRPAGKDNLKQISGLSPLDESTLNNLGVYHFDQIAAWSETEVLWMENHVFARGRVGREDWQGQARALTNAVTG
jgi:predicted flap endonuclease-1-like 5' DNA nuclease